VLKLFAIPFPFPFDFDFDFFFTLLLDFDFECTFDMPLLLYFIFLGSFVLSPSPTLACTVNRRRTTVKSNNVSRIPMVPNFQK